MTGRIKNIHCLYWIIIYRQKLCVKNRMGTLSCLRKQNEVADMGRYRVKKLPAVLQRQESLINVKNLQVNCIRE